MDSHRSLREWAHWFAEWFLLDGSRDAMALGLLVVTFASFAGLRAVGVVDLGRDTTSVLYLFQMLGAGNFTLVTIVISINQLVLSRELRTPGELEAEQESASEYRAAVEEEVDPAVVPESTENFLIVLVRDTRDLLDRLDAEIAEVEDQGVRQDASEFQSALAEELDESIGLLEESDVGVFRSLRTVLDADFSTSINHSRWLRKAHDEELPESLASCLGDLEDRLAQLDVARQYFKTIYVQQELADLSRTVLYTGFLAMAVAAAALVSVETLAVARLTENGLLLVPLAITVTFGPLAVLLTHVLRIATVARRTSAISPFVP